MNTIPQKMKTIKLTGKIMHCRFLLLTNMLHIPDLILKLHVLKLFSNELLPLRWTKWFPVLQEQWKG